MNPYLLQIETFVGCNAKCVMCGMHQLKRKFGEMPWSIFTTAIKDAKEMGISTVIPFINGEPIKDKRLFDILNYIKKEIPNADIGWYTNGQLITKDIVTKLAKVGNVHTFNISIHGGNKETYAKVMGLDWDNLIKKLDILTETNKELGNPFTIKAHFCDFSLTHDSVEGFKQLCTKYNIEPGICCFSNFGGLVHDKYGEGLTSSWEDRVCDRALNHVYILNNGDVVSCCFDIHSVNCFGNITEQSLKDIWNSPKHIEFINKHKNKDYSGLSVCQKCNAKKFNG